MYFGDIDTRTSMHTINNSDALFTFYSKSCLLYFQVTVLLSFHTAKPVFAKGLKYCLIINVLDMIFLTLNLAKEGIMV